MTLLQPLFSVGARSRASAILLAAGLVMATSATTLVAVVPLYADAISEAGFRRSLADADAASRGFEASFRSTTGEFVDQAEAVATTAQGRLPGDLRALAIAETDSLGLSEERYGAGVITSFATIHTDEAVLSLTEGSFDRAPDDGVVAASLHVDAAERLDLDVGDRVELDGRSNGVSLVEVVALVEPADRFDDLWLDQPDIRDAVVVSGSFTEVGPFIVDAATFAALDRSVSVSARGAIDPSTVRTADLDRMRAGAGGIVGAVRDRLPDANVDVTNGLPQLLAATDSALGSTSAVIAVILVQLVGLALYGLGLAAAVLAASRLVETALLRSRGATARQMAVLAATEALFIAVPAAIFGPPLARAVVGLVERWGPVSASGLDLDATVSRGAVLASVVVAVIAVGVVTWPAVRSARALAAAQVERTRPTGPNVLQRSGADIAIAVLAVLGLWQLTQSSAATRDLSGRLGTDPVLVFAPTLGVIAASMVTLRLISIFARGAQSSAASGTGLATALAGWELARRPARTARTSVLVVMSVTIGTFAVVQGSSWEQSQRDQANAIVSADALVVPDQRPAAALAPMFQASAYAQIDGVSEVLPVARPRVTITSELGSIDAVATDLRVAPEVLRLRSDLMADDDQLRALHSPSDLQAVSLGDVAGELTVAYSMERAGTAVPGDILVALLVLDRFGTIHRLDAQPVSVDESTAELRFTTTSDALPGYDLRLAGPIELIEVEVVAPILPGERIAQQTQPLPEFAIELREFRLGGEPVEFVGSEWTVGPLPPNRNTLAVARASIAALDDGLRIDLVTGRSEERGARVTARFSTTPLQTGAVVVVPALVTPALLAELELQIGDTAISRVDGATLEIVLAGTVPVVPFDVDESISMLIDWPTLVAGRYVTTGRFGRPDEWALAASSAVADDLPDIVTTAPLLGVDAVERRAVGRQLANDPFAVGLFGSLGLALAASLLIAVIGLMLTAVVGARERRSSYSVLRAMGAPTRVLRRWLLLEIVPLVGLSAAAGLVAGIVLSRTAIESLTVTGEGARAIPQPTVVIPWPTIAFIVGVAVAAGIALPLLTGRLLGRSSTADDLRIGDAT